MSDTRNILKITTRFFEGMYEVSAEIVPGGVITDDIFLHERNDDGTLGDYIGLAYLSEVPKFPLWNPNLGPTLGVRVVRCPVGIARANTKVAIDDVILVMKSTFRKVVEQYTNGIKGETITYEYTE